MSAAYIRTLARMATRAKPSSMVMSRQGKQKQEFPEMNRRIANPDQFWGFQASTSNNLTEQEYRTVKS